MRHRHHYIYILVVACLLLSACGAERNLKKGEKYLTLGEYYDAASQFRQAYSKTPPKLRAERGQIAAKMAYCYERYGAYQKAIGAYRNVIRYEQDSPETHLLLGRQLLRTGAYKEAEKELLIAADSMKDNELLRQSLLTARKAAQWKAAGSRYTVKKMDVFNSQRADFSPVLLGDQHEQLYFTSTRNQAQGDEMSGITGAKAGDIFLSTKNDKGQWSRPEAIEGGLNTAFDEGACSFSPDQRVMYLTQCKTDPQYPRYAQIVTSNRADAAWGKVADFQITRDTLSSFAHPAVSPDGLWLYFVSDMPGGLGGLDIWRAQLTAAGVGVVENVGAPVNTPGDEMFPTFRPNGDLYFSSDGHAGLGGLDIFIATVGKNGRYQLEHPGFPLNSQGDDFGMTFEGVKNRGFFCSNRNDGRGWESIYSFEYDEIVQTVKGWVYEMDGYELPAAQVYMVGNDGTNLKLSVKGDGSFEQVVKPGTEYLFMATCKGFLNHKESLRVGIVDDSEEHVLQFPLAPISVPVMIDNIFYDFDKATLRPESEKALDELVTLLNENPNVTIELSAHCDYKGTQAYNKKLAQRRAESVVRYLIAKGIAADRLTPVGYGKEKPKTVRKKLAAQYNWLKEGDVLTQEFIGKLDKEKQEICNQLNRRTEFIVLRTTYGMFDKDGNLKNPPKPKPKKQEEDEEEIFFDIEF
ncbi:MAG: OmpA family protein [Bacteroidaceae bacterium]|nr:OmpA family protein [Bacteroidaceae bacterium]